MLYMTTDYRPVPCRDSDPHPPHGWKATLPDGTRHRVTCPGLEHHYATVHPLTITTDWQVAPGVYEKRPQVWYRWRCSRGCTPPKGTMWSHTGGAQQMARHHMDDATPRPDATPTGSGPRDVEAP